MNIHHTCFLAKEVFCGVQVLESKFGVPANPYFCLSVREAHAFGCAGIGEQMRRSEINPGVAVQVLMRIHTYE
jgi:hypothetical protein